MQYTGESMNPDGMVALLNYRVSLSSLLEHRIHSVSFKRRTALLVSSNVFFISDDIQPALPAYFTFWMDGTKEVKL